MFVCGTSIYRKQQRTSFLHTVVRKKTTFGKQEKIRLNVIMTLRLLLILTAVGQWKLTHLVSVSGRISEDLTFIYKTFPVPPSMRAIIEYQVHFDSRFRTGLTMGIYTTQDHANIRKQCTETRYGQLGNKHLHPALNTGLRTCNLKFSHMLYCRDTVTVQDFMPRTFSFSIGFECFYINQASRIRQTSLKGLVYNVSISGQANEIGCATNWGKTDKETCHFDFVTATNLLGNNLSHARYTANTLKVFYNRSVADRKILETNPICYQHFIETACHILLPPCEPRSGLVIQPCKEACYDMLRICKHDHDPYRILDDFWEFDCDYLPSLWDGTPCFYKPVNCLEPPPVKHADKWKEPPPKPVFTGNYYQSQLHNLDDIVTYFCHSGYKLVGNNNIICMNSGEWSALPQCLPESTREHKTGSTIESTTESTTTEFTPEPKPQSTVDFRTECCAEYIIESTAKTTTESTAKFTTDSIIEPTAETKIKSTTESTTESTVKFSTDLKAEPITEHKIVLKGTALAKPAAESKSKSTGTTKINWLIVVIPSVFILLALQFLVVAIRYKIKLKVGTKHGFQREQVRPDQFLTDLKQTGEPLLPVNRKQDSALSLVSVATLKQNRNRIFDAFVLYHFDSDDDFVVNFLLRELEEERHLKLCIHSRNFTPGRNIKDNIEEAIEGSNSAIIVMSQGFVDSIWCKEEFVDCYIENMKDESFNLFVIMMQPAETLINISNYMKTFFETKTYLHVNDPDLFSKLATHLEDARKLEDPEMTT